MPVTLDLRGFSNSARPADPEIERLEADCAGRNAGAHAVATGGAAAGLRLGLLALNILPGEEIIAPDLAHMTTVSPVLGLDAKAVLVDVERETWRLDAACVEAAITGRTRAILAVRLRGAACDLAALSQLARQYGLALIDHAGEGAAGSGLNGGEGFAVASLHDQRSVSIGEGGMVLTGDPDLAARMRTLRAGETALALGEGQARAAGERMAALEALASRRRQLSAAYEAALRGLPARMVPASGAREDRPAWLVLDRDCGVERDQALDALKAQGFDARPFGWPLTAHSLFERRYLNPVSYGLALRGLILPTGPEIEAAEIDRIADILVRVFARRPASRRAGRKI